MRIALGLLIAALACAPAAAQQVALVELPRVGDRSVRFLDLASIRRSGMDVEVRMLGANATSEDEADPVTGLLWTFRISCDWNAYSTIAATAVSLDGEPRTTRPPSDMSLSARTSFIPPKGYQADVAAIACDPAFKAPSAALPSLKDAMAEAARTTRRWPAPEPRDPNAPIPTIRMGPPPKQELLQNFAGAPTPSEYGVVRAEKATGNTLFLDWGNFRRKGDVVQALTFEVLGDDPAKNSLGALMKHSSVEIDCKAKTMRVVGQQTFGRGLKPEFEQYHPWDWRPVAGWPLRAELLDAACRGRKPKQTLATMADAVAFAGEGRR